MRVSRNCDRLIFTTRTMSFQPRPFAPVRFPDNFTIPHATRECYRFIVVGFIIRLGVYGRPCARYQPLLQCCTSLFLDASHDRDNVPFQRPGVLEDRGNLDVYVRFWVTEWQRGFQRPVILLSTWKWWMGRLKEVFSKGTMVDMFSQIDITVGSGMCTIARKSIRTFVETFLNISDTCIVWNFFEFHSHLSCDALRLDR